MARLRKVLSSFRKDELQEVLRSIGIQILVEGARAGKRQVVATALDKCVVSNSELRTLSFV